MIINLPTLKEAQKCLPCPEASPYEGDKYLLYCKCHGFLHRVNTDLTLEKWVRAYIEVYTELEALIGEV